MGERDFWKEVAQSVVPPSKYLVDLITREFADIDSPALLSVAARRSLRKQIQRDLRGQVRNDPMASAAKEYLLGLREKMEAKGFRVTPGRIRKWKDLEAETNNYYNRLAENPELPESIAPISLDKARDIIALLWELAVFGRYKSDTKPKITRSSAIWKILGINPDNLVALNEMNDKDGLLEYLSVFEDLLGLRGQPPEENKLAQLAKWVIKRYLPSDYEPETTPEALSKASIAGLIHRANKIIDTETREVVHVEVADKSIVQPEGMLDLDDNDHLFEFATQAGIDLNQITPKEQERILDLLDFFDTQDKTYKDRYGDKADSEKVQRSRLFRKVKRLTSHRWLK